MFRRLNHRLAHHALLLGVTALLTLPNLGRQSLWDVDEGVNAEAAREMFEAGNWITPTFNFELRTAKPVLLYWLQGASYSFFGVNEFAARLPSALAALLTVLLTYELGRRMFGPSAGLLSGLVLATAIEFCLLAHAATPDATLLLFTVATFACFWLAVEADRTWWFVPAGAAAGLAVLTKGPVGLALPGLVALAYFAWNREWRRLGDRQLWTGFGVFLLVALPWYILVALDTRGVWASRFLGRENLLRFVRPMENHSGPIYYHAVALLALYAPWSVFLGGALWYAARSTRWPESAADVIPAETRAHRLLICWFLAYLVFFSVAATKLPNYVLPLYPALALLTGRFLDAWRQRIISPARWLMSAGSLGLSAVGLCTGLGLLIIGGAVTLPFGKVRVLPGLDTWAVLGLIPVVGGVLGFLAVRRERRDRAVAALAAAAILFVGSLAAFVTSSFEAFKAPRALVASAGANRPDEEVRLGGLFYFQPSLVFYGQREVKKLESFEAAVDFLDLPYPVYMFVPETLWAQLGPKMPVAHRLLGRHFDFLKNCDILVVSNR